MGYSGQGMTLNKVIVDLGRSFEEGQVSFHLDSHVVRGDRLTISCQEYVALSRARSLDGLKVLSMSDSIGKGGNAQVKEFLWQKFGIR